MQDRIKMVRRNVETQARLVDDLLDVTRITRGKLALHFEVVDVHEILTNVLTMFQPQVQAKGIEVRTRLEAVRHHIWADPGRMQQVFLNLLSNAVKFARQGGLIRLETDNDAENRIIVQVIDNGSGIEANLLPRLFTPFEQAPGSRRFGGLGLGLSIVQSLVTMHEGTIRAKSEGKDLGAAFTVELGTIVPARRVLSEGPAKGFTRTYRILLVEDHADTRTVLTRLLTTFGHEVKAVGTIQEALAAARLEKFELMMSDVGLPDGTGLELMAEIRKFSDMRAIALSGFGLDEDIERSRAAGFTMHLTKPINIQQLCEIIQKTME
jgi:CheY-like chemotaxis protein